MISFETAQKYIAQHQLKLEETFVGVAESIGLVLSRDVYAPMDLPPFSNSAVDGFAVRAQDVDVGVSLSVVESIRAVAQEQSWLPQNKTMKIMTGAPLPRGADAVVMKEHVSLKENVAQFHRCTRAHDHVRDRGEDIARGELCAHRGQKITTRMLALFFGLGIQTVPVFRMPRLVIISTGDELVKPGNALSFGQVYYLVGPMLAAQCRELGIESVRTVMVGDSQQDLEKILLRTEDADLVLISGGMSKGEYDFVRPALKRCAVEEIFFQGAWRPGKPLYFGKRGPTLVFGLPGNPVAAFVCFHVFVRTLIYASMNSSTEIMPRCGHLTHDYQKKLGFTFFSRCRVNENNALSILPGQGSHQIHSLSLADALCVLPRNTAIVKAHEVVHYYPLL